MNQDATATNSEQNLPDPDSQSRDSQSHDAPDTPPEGVQVARVNRGWLVKITAVMVVVLGFGIWGYYDATVAYPERGYRASQFLEWQYLQKLAETNQLASASVDDPVAVQAELLKRQAGGVSISPSEGTRLAWLSALENTRLLKPEFTKIPRTNKRETVGSASDRLTVLTKEWTQASGASVQAPKPLTSFDIPVQWLFVVVGIPVGLYQLWLIAKVMKQKYKYDHTTHTLTLADGTTLTPDQLADVDRRRWHKYMVSLIPAAGHPRAGESIELDLLRHKDLEDWVVGMEDIRFPERAAERQARAEGEAEAEPGESEEETKGD